MIFTAPLFLIGLVAVAIPVVVHLFNFRRYKKVYFSNVERLEQLQSETRKQSTLRQILIMAARILAIVFLVLAFARPVIKKGDNTFASGNNLVSVYIDNSFSMDGTDGSVSLLEKAKGKAREIVAAYGPTDRFQLMTSEVAGRQFHWLNKDDMLTEIDDVESSGSTLTIAAAVQKLSDFLSHGGGENRQAYIISDFQASTVDLSDLKKDSTIGLTLVPLESVGRSNVYIDSVALGAPVTNKGSSVTVEVWVCNESDEDLEKQPVTLFVNERQRALATVDLPAQSRSKVDMHFVVDMTGILNCRVETVDYPVTFDDKHYFTLNVRDRISGLIVEGADRNIFLEKLFDGDSTVVMASMAVQQMDFSRIDGTDVIILDELKSMPSGMSQSLKGFVDDGGTAVVILGSDVDVDSYNEALGLFAAPRIGSRRQGRFPVAAVNFDNALYSNVFAGGNKDVEMPTVTDYYRLESSASTIREPIMTLSNGDEYISVTQSGAGRLYLIAAPLRDEHSDFVRQALFVPTVYNMALYSVPPTALYVSFGNEEPLVLSGDYGGTEGKVRMRMDGVPEFEEIPDIRRLGSRFVFFPRGPLNGAGNYILECEGAAKEGVSFNYSRIESHMQFLGADELKKMVKDNNVARCSVVQNSDKPLDVYLKEQTEGYKLWRWCLLLCLLLIALEEVLIRIDFVRKR